MRIAALSQSMLATFEHIVVINLPERSDRRRGITAELAKVGLSLDHPSVTLFPAIRPDTAGEFPSIGAHGAYLSHLAVLRRMMDKGSKRMLVLEDDACFFPEFEDRMIALNETLADKAWDLLYGHAGDGAMQARQSAGPAGLVHIPADLALIRLHFMGITRGTAARLIPYLSAILERPAGSPEGGPMHVDGALNWFRADHPELTVLGTNPPISGQRPSSSDVTPRYWFDKVPMLRDAANAARGLRYR